LIDRGAATVAERQAEQPTCAVAPVPPVPDVFELV